MTVTLRYLAEFGKPAFQYITASICGGIMHESIVFCSARTMSSQRYFTFAISSPDEFLVITFLNVKNKSWFTYLLFHQYLAKLLPSSAKCRLYTGDVYKLSNGVLLLYFGRWYTQGDVGNFMVTACNIYSTLQPYFKSAEISEVRLTRFSASGVYKLYEFIFF